MKICVNCEALLDDSAMFCSKCGSSDLKTENYNTSVDLEEEKTMLIIPEGDDNLETGLLHEDVATEDDTGILSENMAMNSEPSFSAPVEADVDADATGLLNENMANDFSQPIEAPEISIQPAVQESVVQQPVMQQPVMQQPVMQQPVMQQPVMQQPVQPMGAPMQQPYGAMPVMGAPHNGSVSFGQAVSLYFKNYANFSGRASKSEYWWSVLFSFLVSLPISILSAVVPFLGILSLALLIPNLSVMVRRLHDTGKSGAYFFMVLIPLAGPFILLIQLLKDSEGDNLWGPGPRMQINNF